MSTASFHAKSARGGGYESMVAEGMMWTWFRHKKHKSSQEKTIEVFGEFFVFSVPFRGQKLDRP